MKIMPSTPASHFCGGPGTTKNITKQAHLAKENCWKTYPQVGFAGNKGKEKK